MLAKTKITPMVAFASAYIIWGLNSPLVKIGLRSIPLSIFLASKFALASLIVLPWVIKKWHPMKWSINFRILIATFFGYFLNLIFWYEGIKRTNVSTAALIATFAPVILFVLSIKVLKEKFSSKILFGLIISMLGTLLVVVAPQFIRGIQGVSLAGNLFILLAVLTDVAGTILIKPVLKRAKASQVSALRILLATIFFIALASKDLHSFSLSQVTTEGYMAVFLGSITAIVIGLSLYHYGLSRMTVEKGTVLHYLDPIFGIVSSVIVLGEQISTTFLLGAGLIFWGIYVAEARVHLNWLHLRYQHH